jgi:hypothetical protein
MISKLKMIRKPKVRRLETGKHQKEVKKGEPEKGLEECRRGQEVEDERNENKKK